MRFILLLAVAALLLGFGCVLPPADCGGQVCGSDWKTYDTKCQAEAAGVSVLKTGECGLSCTENDGGNSPDRSGSVQYKGRAYADLCQGTKLTEYYCLNNELRNESKQCANGCSNGACITSPLPPPPPPTQTCTDTESGQDVGVAGTVKKGNQNYTDVCANNNQVTDYYCSNNDVVSLTLNCPSDYECKSGICVKEGCVDNDGGSNIYSKGSTTKGDVLNTDFCTSSNIVKEYYCSGDTVYWSTYTCPSGYLCSDGKCVVGDLCEDSDDGDAKYVKGTVTQGDDEFTDYCKDDDTVKEYFCDANGNIDSANRDCPSNYECSGSNGRCTEMAAATACSDNDGGQDTLVKATASDSTGASGTDSCVDSNTVKEYYCSANLLTNADLDCPANNGCLDGKCQPTCSETDGDADYSEAGTTTFGSETHPDTCSGATLTEWSCGVDPFLAPTSSPVVCEDGCTAGQCNPPPAPVCTDSDDATPGAVSSATYSVEGTTTLTGATPFTKYDSCVEATGVLTEWYCSSASVRASTAYTCPFGCDDAADTCNAAPVCTDSDDATPGAVSSSTYTEPGTTTLTGQVTKYDSCNELTGDITEWYCSSASVRASVVYDCAFGCSNVAGPDECTSLSLYTCEDIGDDGNEAFDGGYVKRTYQLPPGGSTYYYDNCVAGSVLEYYCDGSTVKNQTTFCIFGCNTAASGDYCASFDPI